LAVAAAAFPAPASPAPARPDGTAWFSSGVPLTPRVQWNANFGYCGETSLITAGLLRGQYTSQWTARALASPGVPQTQEASQLLLGVNDLVAAEAMRLDASRFDAAGQRGTRPFLSWVKREFARGHTVILGVFNNVRMLGEPFPGDQDYDHVVPVYGVASPRELKPSARLLSDDVLTLSDNGLSTVGVNTPMLFSYRVDGFARTRAQANAAGGPMYSLRTAAPSFGLSVSGVADTDSVTLPVLLSVSSNSEGLQNEPVMASAPAPTPIELTATVTVRDSRKPSVLLMFDSFADVPVAGFNAAAPLATRIWEIPAGVSSFTVKVSALSSDTRVFRAVPASAP
jgi:hypothetical protein